jgi:hypothetical protein
MFNWVILYLVLTAVVMFPVAFHLTEKYPDSKNLRGYLVLFSLLWPLSIVLLILAIALEIIFLPARLGHMLAKRGNKK